MVTKQYEDNFLIVLKKRVLKKIHIKVLHSQALFLLQTYPEVVGESVRGPGLLAAIQPHPFLPVPCSGGDTD